MVAYNLSIIGLLLLCLVSVLLSIHSGYSKGRAGMLSGPVVPADDDNRLYRIDRAHLNSVEALAPFAIPAVVAMMIGLRPSVLAVFVWLYAVIRLAHVAVYLRGGSAAKGGSIRTVLYVSGAMVTVVLIVLTAWVAAY